MDAERRVDLSVAGGGVGFLGPHGAGKSTAVRMLTTLTSIRTARPALAGVDMTADPDAAGRGIGVALQDAGLARAKADESCSCCRPGSTGPPSWQDFAVLADPVRLRLLSLLAPAGEACVCGLDEPLACSQPRVSHHVKVLADAGLIVGEKRGRWVW